MPRQQKSRTPKTSKGEHGSGGKGRNLTETEKILLGGGLLRNVKKRYMNYQN